MRRPHQGIKYAANPEASGWIKDGFTEWRYKTGERIPEAILSEVPNSDKIKISYVRKTVTLARPKPHEFVYFDVKHKSNKGTETIGRVTEYTTEDRVASMIYRYYNPGHAQPCELSGIVKFSGGRESSQMPYLEIPDAIAEAYDLRVDDEVTVSIECMGLSYTFYYHLSQMGLYVSDGGESSHRRLILPLTQIKRLVAVDDPQHTDEDGNPTPLFKYVTKKDYDEQTRQIAKGKPLEYTFYYRPRWKTKANPNRRPVRVRSAPCRRFIDEFVKVTATITPEDRTPNDWPNAHPGRFDLATVTINAFGRVEASEGGED